MYICISAYKQIVLLMQSVFPELVLHLHEDGKVPPALADEVPVGKDLIQAFSSLSHGPYCKAPLDFIYQGSQLRGTPNTLSHCVGESTTASTQPWW